MFQLNTLEFLVDGNRLRPAKDGQINAYAVNADRCVFEFLRDGANDLQWTAVFEDAFGVRYQVIITDDNTAMIPLEVLLIPGEIRVGLWGVSDDATVTTNYVRMVVEDALPADGLDPQGDELGVYRQALYLLRTLERQVAENVTAATDGNADFAAEVVDARAGVDGKSFASLGTHIRTLDEEIAALVAQPTDENSDFAAEVVDSRVGIEERTYQSLGQHIRALALRIAENVSASTDENADYASELVDARVDVDGTAYASLGTHIRIMEAQVVENVKASTDSDADYAAEVVDARVSTQGKVYQTLGGHLRAIAALVAANVTASTDSDADYAAELVDARVGTDSTVHASAGEHIRSLENQLGGLSLSVSDDGCLVISWEE